MSTDKQLAAKAFISKTRITLGLMPGLGAFIALRMAIHLYRPDMEDIEHRVKDYPLENLYECYDFIIIGGGSAGAVVANRLSNNSEWKVLLLEAGQDENVLSEIPVMFPALQLSSIDWQFETEPNEGYCLSMVDGRCKWPRGKVLGGSSVLNAMLYVRGNKRDYDNWEIMGNVGWAYQDVFKYFTKSEDMRILGYEDDAYHRKGGYLSIEHFSYQQPITGKVLEAGKQLGYNILDVNGEYQTGFTRSQATLRDGLRCSTAKAFLRPASKRPNLHISMGSYVEKILIDEHKRAYGVQFVKNGLQRIVKASKEVILSAGSIQSPQLLMLSGIGDAGHLKDLGIHPISNLPGVGKNLQDHVAMGGHSFLIDNPFTNGSDYCFNIKNVMSLGSFMDFTFKRQGELYSMMEAEAMAFVNTKYQDPSEDYPDIQLFIAPTADNMDGGLFGKRANGLTDETYAELYEDILYKSSFSIVPLVLRPKSRGLIRLRDGNPNSPPLIYPNYYSEPEDIKVMIEGARIAQELINQPALQELNARPNPRRNPGCADHELLSDEHLECQARHHTLTIYHPVGTCAMGPVDNPAAVVDPRLRVYGISNLRVVDGSIMPTIVSGNTNAPIIMIAEKASDMIITDWNDISNEETTYTCPVEYQKEIKNAVDATQTNAVPDLFTETANLLPYYADNITAIPQNKLVESKVDNVHSKSLLAKENETRNKGIVPENELLYNEPNANSYQAKISNYNRINELDVDRFSPSYPTYPVQSYPFWYPNTDIGKIYPNQAASSPWNTFNPYGARPYKNYHPNYIYNPQFYNHRPNILKSGNKPVKYNLGDFNFDNKEPVYYETDEVETPRGQKKCKVWLYYDGVKYEVIL